MIVLGISGGLDRLHETHFCHYNKDIHDSAAVLLVNGQVVAGVEEERFDRIKHSNKFPVGAIRYCLESQGLKLSDVDHIAVVNTEETTLRYLTWLHFTFFQGQDFLDGREWLRERLWSEFGEDVERGKIEYVGHHLAHATSAFVNSGYDHGLVVSLDGAGDNDSGTISLADKKRGMRLIRSFSTEASLGVFYQRVCYFLGFKALSEFKVMGLAPYGDASRYRRFFEAVHTLRPDGGYTIDFAKLLPLMGVVRPRKPDEPIDQRHKDIAASLQEMLEKIVFHVLGYYRRQTGERSLTLAGGVAHNCSLNGKLLYSGMFDRIFVQPAAHDGGTALGAAQWVHGEKTKDHAARRQAHVYWGKPLDEAHAVKETAARWDRWLSCEVLDDETLHARAAALMAEGKVLGWVQGRSEFGPRALGNRSILADPRPASHKARINAMVKKREGFRPFAPAVMEEEAHAYFDLPQDVSDSSFMTYAVRVRADKRELLGAVTHVDGTARIQTVSRSTNERFWKLLEAFKDLTGMPVLLNTSFNNHAEPIVDSAQDAITCFLTTGLDHLVVGNCLLSKKDVDLGDVLSMRVQVQTWANLHEEQRMGDAGQRASEFSVAHQVSMPATWKGVRTAISPALFRVLSAANGATSLEQLCALCGIEPAQHEPLVAELRELWALRYVTLLPGEEAVRVARSPRARVSLPSVSERST